MSSSQRPVSLVTGGAGFIGSHVAKHLLANGHDVVIIDDLSGGFEDQLPDGARFIKGCITDVRLIESTFSNFAVDYVFHLAAYAAEGLSHFIRRFNYHNNLIGSVNLINESIRHSIKCFVFTSSIAVYGAAQVPMGEETTPLPEDPYGVSKYAVELDLRAAHATFGLPYIVFRPHNVYGDHQNVGDPYRNVIGIFMRQCLLNQPLTIFGDGLQTRAFSHIDDVAPHIASSVHCPDALNSVFNIGADQTFSVLDVALAVGNALGRAPEVIHLPPRHEVLHAYACHERARRVLGARPSVRLEDGIGRMASWVQGVGIRQSKTFEHIEVDRNLPPSWALLKAARSDSANATRQRSSNNV